jgi:hypothetical protein
MGFSERLQRIDLQCKPAVLVQIPADFLRHDYDIQGLNATAAAGAAQLKSFASRLVDLALKVLDGLDYSQMKRLGDEIPPPAEASVGGKTFAQHNQEIETKQQEWLKKRGLE